MLERYQIGVIKQLKERFLPTAKNKTVPLLQPLPDLMPTSAVAPVQTVEQVQIQQQHYAQQEGETAQPAEPFSGSLDLTKKAGDSTQNESKYVTPEDKEAFDGIGDILKNSKATLTPEEIEFLGLKPKK